MTESPNKLKRSQSMLLGAGLLSVLLMVVPALSLLSMPLVYLNTHIHELCHALAAWATGGNVLKIEVFSGGNGVTYTSGGMGVIISSAGYVGAAAVGAIMIALAKNEKGARLSLNILGGSLAISLLLLVRGDVVGLATGAFWCALAFVCAARLKQDALLFAAQFLGVQQCLWSVVALFVLWKINQIPGIQNDAVNAENLTHLPAPLWAFGWAAISFALMWVALKRAWS